MAHIFASFAQFERRLISQRTKDALAVKKANGVRLGRPRQLPTDVLDRITTMRNNGHTLAAIATALNNDNVPTAQGGRSWYHATISAVLRSIQHDHARVSR